MAASKEKRDHRKEMVDRIIGMMEKAGEWDRPWLPSGTRPHNPVTGTIYRGINALSLMSAGFEDGRFFTFNNIKALSEKAEKAGEAPIRLKKGSKGTPIFKAVKINVGGAENDDASEVSSAKSFMVYAYSGTVFNASQIDGLPAPADADLSTHTPVENAEFAIRAMCEETGLKWEEKPSDNAFYSLTDDKATIPERAKFRDITEFYSTSLHELGHATAHPSRLNRPLSSRKDMDAYAFEELVAELTSYFTSAETGVPYSGKTHQNHAAYLKSWIEGLREDKNALFKACSQAAKASDYIARIANEHREKLASQNVFGEDSLPAPFGVDSELDVDIPFDFSDAMPADDGPTDDVSYISRENAFEEFGIEIDNDFSRINSEEFHAGM